ncbi:hypothetical protein DEU34_0563 [Microbacterium sp. AG1240]|uniref:hypothetical protein n=1 Tax=Microbacterium sp. AG1240 TaxID=2183992 RepID=UPI000F25370C|nr:hypothetical protein [Microbacterium sp. AG1240]RKT36057.1 hypothetical protein DEU34_0563 [Microbacterium sp. AG1240]
MPNDTDFVRIVEEQGRRPVGVPVLLFTDATLAATDETAAAAGDRHSAHVIREAAAAIGVDLADVELFTTQAYLVQSVAGHLVAERDA